LDTDSIIQTRYQSVKLAVALRTARSVVGWSQDELSKLTGIPKITIARFETLEGNLKAEQLMKLLDLYASMGAKLELSAGSGFTLSVEDKMINLAGERLSDNSQRRADRKKGRGIF
jgi:transcriptional regulator with XRE-family HTH domain